ncbi:MAG: WbqC family protein, partial [Anaerolineales bacterium]
HYISGPSARDYIEAEKFAAANISLEYIQYDYPEYPQLYPPYDPFVTVLDLLFMVGSDASQYFEKGKS